MKFVYNAELQKEVNELKGFINDISRDVSVLNEAITDHETDDMDAMSTYDNNVFELRQRLFDAKLAVDKLHKKIHKHISETLAPDHYAQKLSARRKKDVVKANIDKVASDIGKVLNRISPEPTKGITISRKKDEI